MHRFEDPLDQAAAISALGSGGWHGSWDAIAEMLDGDAVTAYAATTALAELCTRQTLHRFIDLLARLDDAGLTVGIVDLPYSPHASRIEGVQISDWLMHNKTYGQPRSTPAKRIEAVMAAHGTDPEPVCDRPGRTPAQFRRLVDQLCSRARRKSDLLAELLAERDWDFFLGAYSEPHCAGHQCWHLHDPTHPDHDPAWRSRFGDPVEATYSALCEGLDRVVGRIDPDATLLLFAGPSMQGNYGANHVLDEILEAFEGDLAAVRGSRIVRMSRRAYNGMVPDRLRQALWARAIDARERMVARTRRSRQCYAVPHNEISGAIRVNLVGREPDGKVGPEAYHDFCERLREALLGLRDLHSGRPVVDAVHRSGELFQGPRLDELPDLFVCWNRDAPSGAIGSAELGEFRRSYPGCRTGDHTARCSAWLRTPGVSRSTLPERLSILDFASSTLHAFGLSTAGLEGRAVEWRGGEPR